MQFAKREEKKNILFLFIILSLCGCSQDIVASILYVLIDVMLCIQRIKCKKKFYEPIRLSEMENKEQRDMFNGFAKCIYFIC